jgi:hypothetical protein
MQLFDKIIEKLKKGTERPYLIKRFDFTLEDIQDNPDQIKNIIDYLESHLGKWEDFDILAQIDSETIKPYVLLILYVEKDLANHLIPFEHTILSKINPK